MEGNLFSLALKMSLKGQIEQRGFAQDAFGIILAVNASTIGNGEFKRY